MGFDLIEELRPHFPARELTEKLLIEVALKAQKAHSRTAQVLNFRRCSKNQSLAVAHVVSKLSKLWALALNKHLTLLRELVQFDVCTSFDARSHHDNRVCFKLEQLALVEVFASN